MSIESLDDLYRAYCSCDHKHVATKAQLEADYYAWVKAWEQPSEYSKSGVAYLFAPDGQLNNLTRVIWTEENQRLGIDTRVEIE